MVSYGEVFEKLNFMALYGTSFSNVTLNKIAKLRY